MNVRENHRTYSRGEHGGRSIPLHQSTLSMGAGCEPWTSPQHRPRRIARSAPGQLARALRMVGGVGDESGQAGPPAGAGRSPARLAVPFRGDRPGVPRREGAVPGALSAVCDDVQPGRLCPLPDRTKRRPLCGRLWQNLQPDRGQPQTRSTKLRHVLRDLRASRSSRFVIFALRDLRALRAFVIR